MSERDQILSIFRSTEALLDGHFVLTSGRHSASYFQCAKVLQHPEYLTAFSIMIADEFEPQAPDLVISPAIGGVVLGTEVGTQLGCRTIFAERKEGNMVIRRGFHIEKGEKVLVVEDVITTGGSVFELIELTQQYEAEIVGIVNLVERSKNPIDFGVNSIPLLNLPSVSWEADECPLCKDEIPLIQHGRSGK